MKNVFPKTIFGFYRQLASKFWLFLSSILVFQITHSVLFYTLPSLSVKWLADGVENAIPNISLVSQMVPILTVIAAAALVMLLTDIFGDWILGRYEPLVRAKVTEMVYSRLSMQSVAFFKDNSAGFLVEQSGYIINRFRKIVVDHVGEVLILVFSIAVNVSILFQIHWVIAAVFLVCAAFRLGWCSFFVGRIWDTSRRASRLSSELGAKHVDSLSNFMKLKLFARRNNEQIYLNKARMMRAKAQQERNYVQRVFWILPYTIEQICYVGTIVLALWLFQSGSIHVGDIAFSIISFATMMKLVRSMTWKLPEITDDLSSVTQAYKDIAKPISVTEAPRAKNLKPKKCQINFDNISFRYGENPWIFKDMNLCIKAGEKVGLVGLSGSGKSTLLYLLMRLYDVNKGAIKIDGKDLRMVTMDSLRGVVSFVPQDCTLFNRTLAENISYGACGAKKNDIVGAAKKAEAHDFIMRTEKGYDSCPGDRGVQLSGGQRQRVGIAHAICKNAPIIVMDEATSALDSETEMAVQEALGRMLKDRTAIVVAHRLSTLRQMDRIIVLDKGKIVEEGTHAQLLKIKNGIYARLWSMQSSGFIHQD
ncbi:MAG: ABC transporter ATP-binding protein/permease [Alphaproteobacteria bacterium]|nr:ABC transporter ATP-binding protein/permease [Alphaproteobacteria bacterium]